MTELRFERLIGRGSSQFELLVVWSGGMGSNKGALLALPRTEEEYLLTVGGESMTTVTLC